MKNFKLPLSSKDIENLHAGDELTLSGTIYTARDAAHKKLIELLETDKDLPLPLENQAIYYVGPTPAPEGKAVGSAGPTTSSRMDKYTPALLEKGLKIMIGKGSRTQPVKDAIIKNQALYLGALGGAGALLSKCIISSKVIAFEDLGPEAVRELTVKDFPVIVINDIHGKDLYQEISKGA